jgi:hypothetical protein
MDHKHDVRSTFKKIEKIQLPIMEEQYKKSGQNTEKEL